MARSYSLFISFAVGNTINYLGSLGFPRILQWHRQEWTCSTCFIFIFFFSRKSVIVHVSGGGRTGINDPSWTHTYVYRHLPQAIAHASSVCAHVRQLGRVFDPRLYETWKGGRRHRLFPPPPHLAFVSRTFPSAFILWARLRTPRSQWKGDGRSVDVKYDIVYSSDNHITINCTYKIIYID